MFNAFKYIHLKNSEHLVCSQIPDSVVEPSG